jgi:hypothetical protein
VDEGSICPGVDGRGEIGDDGLGGEGGDVDGSGISLRLRKLDWKCVFEQPKSALKLVW